jgi:DNA mismatch repair protein MutS
MAKTKITPVRKQYLEIKRQHPEAIVFFRLGDFYETFDQDAEIAARELDLVLTGRNVGKNQRVPMAGVPHHAAEGYIAKLIEKGYKVALCDQVGTETINGLMPRDVTRVFTAGTLIEPGMLDASRNNFLASIVRDGERSGLAYADVSTGEFATTQLPTLRALNEELARLNPAELLLPDEELAFNGQETGVIPISRLPGWRFEEGNAEQALLRHFGVSTLAGFGCEGKPLAIRAAGALVAYLLETQKGVIKQIQRLATYSVDRFMAIDSASRRNLELLESIDGSKSNSLLGVLDKTVTPMGKRLLRERISRPLIGVSDLENRLDEVEAFFQNGLQRAEIRALIKGMPDLERLTNRAMNETASPRDLENIAHSISLIPELIQQLTDYGKQANEDQPEGQERTPLNELAKRLDPCFDTLSLIQEALTENAPANLSKPGVFRPGFSAELDGVMSSSAHAREWVANLEPRERQRSGIGSLKVGFNKVFGYYIEVTKANASSVPDDYIRKQTLTNAERYITPELKEYETLILNAEERILDIERRLFIELRQRIAAGAKPLLNNAASIGEIDVAAALAEVASNNAYIRPLLSSDTTLEITEGRHPVVEHAQSIDRFVPNDCVFNVQERIQIITGPNMSGKSTYLRQVALIALMAQIGSFVPAKNAKIGLSDRIFTRIGAHDELHAGRSTFMVEMVEAAEILNHATDRSLLILDEIGRGTSTYDGLSIAWAIVEYLHNHPRLKPRTLFATHYHELTGLAEILPMVSNYNVDVAEEGDKVVFLHHIVPGGADRSYGIHVAQLAGLPRDVINRAKEILENLERHAPTTSVEPSHLKSSQQMMLFPETSPILKELKALDVTSMTPLEAINKLYEWRRRYIEDE